MKTASIILTTAILAAIGAALYAQGTSHASADRAGYLSSTDWTTFNAKIGPTGNQAIAGNLDLTGFLEATSFQSDSVTSGTVVSLKSAATTGWGFDVTDGKPAVFVSGTKTGYTGSVQATDGVITIVNGIVTAYTPD